MPEKAEKKSIDSSPDKEIVFTCKFCGETRPLRDLIVMRQFYPPIAACRDCARAARITN